MGDKLTETMASYKVVGVLFVLALVGCALIGTKAARGARVAEGLKVMLDIYHNPTLDQDKKDELIKKAMKDYNMPSLSDPSTWEDADDSGDVPYSSDEDEDVSTYSPRVYSDDEY